MRTSVKYRHKEKYSISEVCRFFEVSQSGYYEYVVRMNIPAKDSPLAEKIQECQNKCGKTYGYRRVHIWLERQGVHHNPKTILRIMQKYNLLSVVRRKKYRNYGEYLHRYNNERIQLKTKLTSQECDVSILFKKINIDAIGALFCAVCTNWCTS